MIDFENLPLEEVWALMDHPNKDTSLKAKKEVVRRMTMNAPVLKQEK